MRFDDAKLRAQVREETLREVAEWCAERSDEAFCRRDRAREAAFLAAMNHCLGLKAQTVAAAALRRPAPTEDDGFTTVHPPVWPAIDGGLDG